MDELSLFKGANKEIIEQEKILLRKADIVFTGGKSLNESTRYISPTKTLEYMAAEKPIIGAGISGSVIAEPQVLMQYE
jgi:6-phosphogluconate dehydrogenase